MIASTQAAASGPQTSDPFCTLFARCGRGALTLFLFFFNEPAPPEISPLSLPDALPIFEEVPSELAEVRGEIARRGHEEHARIERGMTRPRCGALPGGHRRGKRRRLVGETPAEEIGRAHV